MRLPTVLQPPLFSPAELAALRLDGELVAVGDSAVAIDTPLDAGVRAQSIAAGRPSRLHVAAGLTAAWVHGAIEPPVRPHRWVVPSGGPRPSSPRLADRRLLLAPQEIVLIGGVPVTSAVRTAADLARESTRDADVDAVLRALLSLARVSSDAAGDALAAGPVLPFKRRGVARLRALHVAP